MGSLLGSLYSISIVMYIVMYITFLVNTVKGDLSKITEQGLYRSFVVDIILGAVPIINWILAYNLYKANRAILDNES